MKRYIGLMSGTSMDGIDAALVDLDTNQLIEGMTCPYSPDLQKLLQQALSEPKNTLGFYSQLNTCIGREFADAALRVLKKTELSAMDVIAIGSHGQTLCHDPDSEIPYSVQLGCAHTIAEKTGIPVVADFRTRDLILGGQGAPLAPLFHQAIFKNEKKPLAVVNIGGIANLTYLPNEKELSGYDTGPGNCLMDAWTYKHCGSSYDKDGNWAAKGKVIESLLNDMLFDDYFQKSPPKSTSKEYFSLDWLHTFLPTNYIAEDVQATLMQLTAHTIAKSIQALPLVLDQVFLCGGGVHNQALFQTLLKLLLPTRIASTSVLGIHPDFIEAMMMAWLAENTMEGRKLHLDTITGASRPALLGAIFPANA